jgi:hypothetical protein
MTRVPFVDPRLRQAPCWKATSREHAIQLSKDFLDVAGDGETDVHEITQPEPA